jgi:uncharacterized phage protein (predicted DNA packaging)
MITLQQAKQYLKIDSDYDDEYINTLIDTSLIYIDSCVGDAYKTDEKAVKLANLLQLKLMSDLYDQRDYEVANNVKQDKIVTTILDKLGNYT